MRAYFGEFNVSVKASRIKRDARRASDIKVLKPDASGELKEVSTIERKGLGRAKHGKSGYEPEEVTRLVS